MSNCSFLSIAKLSIIMAKKGYWVTCLNVFNAKSLFLLLFHTVDTYFMWRFSAFFFYIRNKCSTFAAQKTD